jgi:hypothetical protein
MAMFFHFPSLLFFLVPLLLVIHVVRTGRNTMWIWVIVIGSYIGAMAYFVVEILPDLMRGRTARRAKSVLRDVVDPARDLRDAEKKLRLNDSVDSRRKIADELLSRGRFDEAIEHYRSAMTGIYEHEPLLMLGIAKAQFARGLYAESRQTMEDLMSHNAGFKSPDRQLLYARALEAEGSSSKALREYELATRTFLGTEALYRYGSLLKRSGQSERGNEVLQEVLNKAELSNAGFRREQREWIEAAKRELG